MKGKTVEDCSNSPTERRASGYLTLFRFAPRFDFRFRASSLRPLSTFLVAAASSRFFTSNFLLRSATWLALN